MLFIVYASSEKNRMLACRFGEHRDNSRNSQSVFLVVYDNRMFAERAFYYFGECLPDLRRNQESMSYEKLYFATRQMPDATHRVKMYWLVLF